MTDQDRPSSPRRRAFLHGATSAGVASMLAPHTAVARAQVSAVPAASSAPGSAITVRTTEHLVGSAVNHAYAVKAGPFVFLNGHEGFDFAAGVVPAVAGAPGFPDYGKPGLRREADYVLDRMGHILNSFGTDFAHTVRLDQYFTEANAVRAYHLARFAAFGKYIPPSTSMITEGCFGATSTMTTSLLAVLPDPQWEVQGIYPKDAAFFAYSGYAPAVAANEFVFAAGAGPDVKDVRGTDPPGGPHYQWSTALPIRRQAESALKKIESTLDAAGTSLGNCVKAHVHVAGAENVPDFLDVWNAHVGSAPAALTVTPAKAFSAAEIVVSINYILHQGRRPAPQGDRARGYPRDGRLFAGGARGRARVQSGPAAGDTRGNGRGPAGRSFPGALSQEPAPGEYPLRACRSDRESRRHHDAQSRARQLLGERHPRISRASRSPGRGVTATRRIRSPAWSRRSCLRSARR